MPEASGVLGQQVDDQQTALDRELLGQALVGVLGDDMRDLMGDYGGELILGSWRRGASRY